MWYTIQPGDTLWGIAQSAYGDGNRYWDIFNVNDTIDNPDVIYAGQQIWIPDPVYTVTGGGGGGGGGGGYSYDVATIQQQLNYYLSQYGYATLVVDGINGVNTTNAIRWFQELNGLVIDGIVGPNTAAYLGI